MSFQNEDRLHLLVVGILEGRYFMSRPGNLLCVEIMFAGKKLVTDPVPHQPSPHINTELCWEIPHKQLQQFRLHRTPLKLVLFASDHRTKTREQIGYLMLDLRSAQQKPAKAHWNRLLNVSYPRIKPELLVQFSLEDCIDTIDSTPLITLPMLQPDHSDLLQLRLDPKHGYFSIESDNTSDPAAKQLFILAFTLKALLQPHNYFSYGTTQSQANLEIIFTLLGNQVRSELFTLSLLAETDSSTHQSQAITNTFQSERTTMRISATKSSLEQLLNSYSPVNIELICESVSMAKADLSLSQLAVDISSIPTQVVISYTSRRF